MKQILFNTENVKALLEGRKTVTRRTIKPQPVARLFPMPRSSCWPEHFASSEEMRVYRPPYQIGDVLWVRETWAHPSDTEVKAGASPTAYIYKADVPLLSCAYDHWRSPYHMPREAARIFLRVTGVRVERLQEISGEDIRAEGVLGTHFQAPTRGAFVNVWNHTIKPAELPAYGWEANPWVWVIAFERISREEAEG